MRDRVVVVTGSSRGIGLAIARACAANGATVVLNGRDPHALAAAVESIVAQGGRATGIVADLTHAAGVRALLDDGALATFGRVDFLINNAGRSAAAASAWELPVDELRATIETNVVAPFACARAVIAWAVGGGHTARIVNISSGAVVHAPANAADYVASKHALDGLTRALARDCAGSRVTVVGVQLGAHRTEMTRARFAAWENLPAAATASTPILQAMTLPAAMVHGRILDGARLAIDPEGEACLARAALPTLALAAANQLANRRGPSPRVHAALATAAMTLAQLPDPECVALRRALATKFDRPLASIVVGAGITELLDRALGLLLRRGESLVAHAPCWPVLPSLCAKHGVVWRRVPYRFDATHSQMTNDLEALLLAIDETTRAIYLASPANPTGAALDHAALADFLARVPAALTVIIDEAYADYVDAPSAASITGQRVIVLRTFSKFFALAALRVGYAFVTPPSLATHLAAAGLPFVVAGPAQAAALAALEDVEHAQQTFAENVRARAALVAALDAAEVEWLRSDAPFVLVASPSAPQFFGKYALWPVGDAADTERRVAALIEDPHVQR